MSVKVAKVYSIYYIWTTSDEYQFSSEFDSLGLSFVTFEMIEEKPVVTFSPVVVGE